MSVVSRGAPPARGAVGSTIAVYRASSSSGPACAYGRMLCASGALHVSTTGCSRSSGLEYEWGARAVTCPSQLCLPVFRRRLHMRFDLKETLDEVHVATQALFAASQRAARMSLRCYQSDVVSERRRYYQEVWLRQHRLDNEPFPTGPGLRRRMSRKGPGPCRRSSSSYRAGSSSDTSSTGPTHRRAA